MQKLLEKFDKGTGSALFFDLSLEEERLLAVNQIVCDCITPAEANKKLPNSQMSGPLFVECRNYFENPNSCQGMVCAYVTPELLSL